MTDQWELCSVGLSVKLDSPQGGHKKYALDEYVNLFINPDFKVKGDQAYQDVIYPRLLLEGWEPFCAVSSISMFQDEVYFRRKIKCKPLPR
jgi:hypothetical protein